MRACFAVIVVVAMLAAPSAAQTIHHVPQEHPTIQAAVDAAANGDLILVSAGNYPESVVVSGFTALEIRGKGKVVIAPPSGPGLLLDTCSGCTLEKLRVEGGDNGFRLKDTSNTEVRKCRTSGTSNQGFLLEGGHNDVLDHCVVQSPSGGDAITLLNSGGAFASNDTLSHCKVLQSPGDGIVIYGTNDVVDHCTVADTGAHGIRCDDVLHCSGDSITHCKITGAGFDGIHFSGTTGLVDSCTVLKPGGFGIVDIGGSLDEISHCKILHAGTAGFATGDLSVQVTIHDCKLIKPGTDGIAISGMGNAVHTNKVSHAGEDGVDVSGSSTDVTDNTADGSAGNGFVLSAGGGGSNTLSGNKAHGSGGFDFDDLAGDRSNVVDDTNDFGTTGP